MATTASAWNKVQTSSLQIADCIVSPKSILGKSQYYKFNWHSDRSECLFVWVWGGRCGAAATLVMEDATVVFAHSANCTVRSPLSAECRVHSAQWEWLTVMTLIRSWPECSCTFNKPHNHQQRHHPNPNWRHQLGHRCHHTTFFDFDEIGGKCNYQAWLSDIDWQDLNQQFYLSTFTNVFDPIEKYIQRIQSGQFCPFGLMNEWMHFGHFGSCF